MTIHDDRSQPVKERYNPKLSMREHAYNLALGKLSLENCHEFRPIWVTHKTLL